jgi:LytS/YehU family sensor histidine kinase
MISESPARIRQLELALLRSRVEAHFVYNALNTIAGDSYGGANVISLMEALGGFLNFMLRAGEPPGVSFGDELDAVAAYLAIEKARHRERIDIRYDVDPACRDLRVPGLFLQPLVENALKHGRKTPQAVLRILISVTCRDRLFRLRVTNTGDWVPPPAATSAAAAVTSGRGDEMIRQALELLYPGRYDYFLVAGGGTVTAELSIRDPKGAADSDPL